MRYILFFGFLVLVIVLASCSTIKTVYDPAPASIDTGMKRVETEICGHEDIGENGCSIDQGTYPSELKIRRILSGTISIIGKNCGIDTSFRYEVATDPWVHVDLTTLAESYLTTDCVLTIYQHPDMPGRGDLTFPTRGLYGTVTLISCPTGAVCGFEAIQGREGWNTPPWHTEATGKGFYALRGCGKDLIPSTGFDAPLVLNLGAYTGNIPGGDGCTFVLGIKGNDGKIYKYYRKAWFYRMDALIIPKPSITPIENGKISFIADPAVSFTIIDDDPEVYGFQGTFIPKPDGDTLRFYTAAGRSLVVFVKDGKVVWSK